MFSELPLVFTLTRDTKPVQTSPAPDPVYGYSTDCLPEGFVFHAPPGSTVEIHVSVKARSRDSLSGDLIVIPYWKSDVKDRLVGISLTETFEPVCRLLAICAAAALIAGVYIASRKSSRRAEE